MTMARWLMDGRPELAGFAARSTTPTAAGDFGAFIGRARGIVGAAVAAVWNSAAMIRDPYTKANTGEVALTLTTLWGFDLPRASNFARLKFVA